MDNSEKNRSINLLILVFYTVLDVVLIMESFLLDWDKSAVVLLVVGLIISWSVHISEKVPEQFSLWIYFPMTMIAFFFYGIHETSIFDLAPTMIVVMLMYATTNYYLLIRLCTCTYVFTMIYDFLFVVDQLQINALSVSRTMLHFLLVFFAEQLIKSNIKRVKREKKYIQSKVMELEAENRKAENFLVNVSHELRTPINAVMGLATVLLGNEQNEGKRKDLLYIKRAGYRLFNQIESILDYTEIDSGKVSISEDVYMIPSLVNDIISAEQANREADEVELIFDVDMEDTSGLIGDGEKIKKIIKHLISNAKKFTHEGGVLVKIYTMPREYGVNICINVKDTGCGIPKEKLAKISDRFYQSNSERNRSAGGLGLGLPIVFGMVSEMGGFVRIDSVEGTGTNVSISIPQKVSDSQFDVPLAVGQDVCVGCYLKPDKYAVPEIRNYYNDMIARIVKTLGISLHLCSDEKELDHVLNTYELTHLFVGKEEYLARPDFYEEIGTDIMVVVVTNEGNVVPEHSHVQKILKPFYYMPILNLLNSNKKQVEESNGRKQMICPDIKTLIVDDEPMNLMVAEGILKNYQMDVKTANSGRKAIEMCLAEDFDVIFLDHMMPEMDGVDTLKILRKNNLDENHNMIVIAFTANAVSGAREMFLREGFDEFVSKPVEILEMERVLKKVLPKNAITYVTQEEQQEKQELLEVTELSPNSKSEEKVDISGLSEVGIDVGSGLNYCQKDEDFYKEVLKSYVKESVKRQEDMDDFFAKMDVKNYQIVVHSLKSSSKMIGAQKLSNQAKELEDAAKQKDENYIIAHHQEVLEQYQEVLGGIKAILGDTSDQKVMPQELDTVQSEPLDELDQTSFLEQLTQLKESLSTFEADKAQQFIDELVEKTYQGKPVSDDFITIQQDIDEFELDAAAQKVETLMEIIKGGDAE